MDCSNLGFQLWAIAIFLFATNLKGISSMKLHRDLGVTRKTAWFLPHRIRETWQDTSAWFAWGTSEKRGMDMLIPTWIV